MSQRILKAHFALFFVNALYGANHILAKGVMPAYLTPNVFILLRVVGATILFWVIKLLFFKERVQRQDLFLLAICGFFGVAANQLFFFHGLNLSSAMNSGIIMTLNPIMVAVLAFFVLKEQMFPWKIVGILLGALGAILLTLNSGKVVGDSMLGDLLLFINAVSYAFFLVLVKPLMQKYSPITVSAYVFSFGTLFVVLFPPTIRDVLVTNFLIIPVAIWYKILYVVVGVTFLAYLLTVYGLKHLSASVSSSYIYFQPMLVVFFAYFFLVLGVSEDYTHTITIEKIGYMLLIFIGVFLVIQSKKWQGS